MAAWQGALTPPSPAAAHQRLQQVGECMFIRANPISEGVGEANPEVVNMGESCPHFSPGLLTL